MPSRDMIVRSVTPPGSFGKVFGFVTTGFHIGGMVAPIIFGQLLDHGHPRAVFLYIAACALVAIATVAFGMSGRRTAGCAWPPPAASAFSVRMPERHAGTTMEARHASATFAILGRRIRRACRSADRGPAPAADFYAGKTIDFVIGGDVGGGYDIYARRDRPPSQPLHSGQSHHRSEEPARRRQRAGGGLHLFGGAEGRDGDRRGVSRRDHGSAARRSGAAAVRPDQVPVSRQRRQRDAAVHHARDDRGSRPSRTRKAQDHHGRERGGRLHPRLRQHAQEDQRRAVRAGFAATRAPPTSCWPWSAARSTDCAATIGRA